MKNKADTNKIIQIVTAAVVAAIVIGATVWLMPYIVKLRDESARAEFESYIRSLGIWGMVVMFFFQIAQVILAVIPGEPVEIIMGALYGTFGGLAMCLGGVIAGTALIFVCVKQFGKNFIDKFCNSAGFAKLKFLHDPTKRDAAMFILFFVPGTPKDMITYFAPFTKITLPKLLIISSVARIPSMVSSTYLGNSLIKGDYLKSVVVFLVIGAVSLAGLIFYDRYMKKNNKDSGDGETGAVMNSEFKPVCGQEKLVAPDVIRNELTIAGRVAQYFQNLGMTGENRPKCFIQTFGCQQNEADSERMAALANAMGYEISDTPDGASLILVNTCAIREHAEKKAMSIIGQYKHEKDKNPDLVIGVGGCMVTQKHRSDKLKNSYPYVSFTFDTGSLQLLPELVYGALTNGMRRFEIGDEYLIPEGLPIYRHDAHKAWLSVMYGCNNFCSYCIVPYVRGRERSRLPSDIIAEAKSLIDSGAKDITLLGQNVNSYGADLGGDCNFAGIMREICALDGDFRLRFMTSHPKDVSDELIAVIRDEAKVVKHFHLPLQSGSDDVLARMNRKYTTERYMKIIDKLKTAVPDISLTSDIIVGFPGETDSDFEETLKILEAVRYDMIFTFIYSPRIGTPAAKMDGQIPKEVSGERFERMLNIQNKISLERNNRFVGRRIRVLIEEVSKTDPAMLTGRADSPRPIHFKADKSLIGSFADVKITSADTFSLNAELCNK